MKITEEKSTPGLLLLIDFEKAFDTIEWRFTDKCLKYFNFGASLRSWIKKFYSSISSSVCSNCHIPEFFKISRGVRQGDPLSPYLFLIVGEVLYRAANRNKKIIGINIGSYTFLMNQFADDTCMFLDGTEESLKACLDLYDDYDPLISAIDKLLAGWGKEQIINHYG